MQSFKESTWRLIWKLSVIIIVLSVIMPVTDAFEDSGSRVLQKGDIWKLDIPDVQKGDTIKYYVFATTLKEDITTYFLSPSGKSVRRYEHCIGFAFNEVSFESDETGTWVLVVEAVNDTNMSYGVKTERSLLWYLSWIIGILVILIVGCIIGYLIAKNQKKKIRSNAKKAESSIGKH
jgi:uncharacterized protein YpmB